MKVYRINKLFFLTLFASVSALSGTFKDLNPDYLVKYFNSNIQAKCPMSPVQILDIFKNPNISQTQSDCFVLDRTNVSDIKYVMKPVGGCSPDALHPKLLSISTSMCPSTTAASTSSGTKTGASTGGGITAQDIAQTAISGAVIAQQYQRNVALQKKEDAKVAKASPTDPAAPKDKPATEAAVPAVAASAPQAAAAAGAANTVAQQAPQLQVGDEFQFGPDNKLKLSENGQILDSEGTPISYDNIKNHELCTADCQASLNRLPAEAKGIAADVTQPIPATPVVDAAAQTAANAGKEAAQSGSAEIAATTAPVVSAECSALAATVKASAQKYQAEMTTCTGNASTADNLCQLTRSPKAILVQQLMTVGTTLISKMSSASQTCGSTADLSKIAQMGMTAASLACSGMKMMCETSCGKASTTLKEIQGYSAKMKACGISLVAQGQAEIASSVGSNPKGTYDVTQGQTSQASSAKLDGVLAKETGAVTTVTAQCNKYAADIVQMVTQVAGLALAAQQAKDCKEKLTAGGGTGTGSGTVTMDEMCKDPTQAQTLVCKCKVDATAAGCPGAVVKTTNKDGGPLVIKGNGSGSQLAGIDAFRQGSGLSSAAKTALGLDSNSAASTAGSPLNSNFGDSGVAAATSGAATDARGSLSASGSDDKNKSDLAKDKKFSFGSFGSLGSAIGGFFGGSGSKKSDAAGNFGTEKQIAAAKRQIANEQLRSEISTASGRSNWDKVRTRYVESNSTFIGN
jgi:hypothetical protein